MIEATSTNIVLPEDVQAAVLAARDNVSLLEAEAGRLERLILSQKRELVSLDGALNDIKTQIDTITLQRIDIVKEIEGLNESKALVQADITALEATATETRANLAQKEQELNEREIVLSQAEYTQREAISALTQRAKTVEIEEGIIASKKLTLSEALAQL